MKKRGFNNNEYIGNKDSMGKKQGFGLEVDYKGNKFIGIFSNDKKKGWGKCPKYLS